MSQSDELVRWAVKWLHWRKENVDQGICLTWKPWLFFLAHQNLLSPAPNENLAPTSPLKIPFTATPPSTHTHQVIITKPIGTKVSCITFSSPPLYRPLSLHQTRGFRLLIATGTSPWSETTFRENFAHISILLSALFAHQSLTHPISIGQLRPPGCQSVERSSCDVLMCLEI